MPGNVEPKKTEKTEENQDKQTLGAGQTKKITKKHGLCPFGCLGVYEILEGQKGDQGGDPKWPKFNMG